MVKLYLYYENFQRNFHPSNPINLRLGTRVVYRCQYNIFIGFISLPGPLR